MATPRKKYKIRDYDKTRKRMLEVVGEILRDTGYTGLKTNQIARRLGKDKNLIRYYFNSLVNLEKAYIRENDYWFAFFERFNLPDNPGEKEVEQFFIDLMLENFAFFRENTEMQKIILWQVSESNPLMRSVSDQRETEGEKLLQMTDPYFNGTNVSFRAVTAILLGGIYYLVLHAETNKSTVCSLDINLEKDRKSIAGTIEQIISWAWQQGGAGSSRKVSQSENTDLGFRWEQAMDKLETKGADPVLLKIMDLPFRRLSKGKDSGYMSIFVEAIENYVSSSVTGTTSLLWQLIALNFNHSRFAAYCFSSWEEETRYLPRDKAIEKLAAIRRTVAEQKMVTNLSFEPRNQPLKEELDSWIAEEVALLSSGKSEMKSTQQLAVKLKAVQSAYFSIDERRTLEPIEKMLEEMLADVRKKL